MIPFDFDYYRPNTIAEAVNLYKELDHHRKEPLYYTGGSEIITLARMNNIFTRAVIDLKAIPECNVLEFQGSDLIIGGAVTLSRISESKLFPLMGKVCGRIADHTNQCKITLGGNLAGTIIYRETVLPLLLTDSYVVITRLDGLLKQVSIHDVFKERLLLDKGCFVVQVMLNRSYADSPFVHVKKTKNEKIDYPLLSLSAIKKDGNIRVAMSGVCEFPFRSSLIEQELNNTDMDIETRVNNVISKIPSHILNDISGSSKYREFVLRETLKNTLTTLEGA